MSLLSIQEKQGSLTRTQAQGVQITDRIWLGLCAPALADTNVAPKMASRAGSCFAPRVIFSSSFPHLNFEIQSL